jgi:5'-methylthioadenosine phosphorylase
MHAPIGIIGGSGLYDLPAVRDAQQLTVQTPFGPPSAPLLRGTWMNRPVIFLPRHGKPHRLLPGEINARANLYALKSQGVHQVVAISAVGSLSDEIMPSHVVTVDQFVDRTAGRPNTFFGDGIVAHVSMADPVCGRLRRALGNAAARHTTVHEHATYLCVEGPQFSTRAESHLWRAQNAHVVGMTGMPEARLAREAELCYALVALPTDYDSWKEDVAPVTADAVARGLLATRDTLLRWLPEALAAIDDGEQCGCQRSLDHALFTPDRAIEPSVRERLGPILARRLRALDRVKH